MRVGEDDLRDGCLTRYQPREQSTNHSSCQACLWMVCEVYAWSMIFFLPTFPLIIQDPTNSLPRCNRQNHPWNHPELAKCSSNRRSTIHPTPLINGQDKSCHSTAVHLRSVAEVRSWTDAENRNWPNRTDGSVLVRFSPTPPVDSSVLSSQISESLRTGSEQVRTGTEPTTELF